MNTVLRRGLQGLLSLALVAGSGLAATQAAVNDAQVLAPSGVLRLGVYRGSPTSIIEGATPREARGVAYDLGRQLASALGVPCETVVYPANAPLLKALQAGKVDVVFTNATKERAQHMDFSQTFMSVEKSLLVPQDSPLKSLADANRPGLKVGVSRGSSSSEELLKVYPQISTQAIDTLQHAAQMLAKHQIDAFGTNDAILYQMSDKVPGSRVLPGHQVIVIEDRAAVADFIRDLNGSRVLYVRIRSLNAGRSTAEFNLDGSAAAVQAAFAGCPLTPPVEAGRKRQTTEVVIRPHKQLA